MVDIDFPTFVKNLNMILDGTATSVAELAKPTTISGPIFIDESILDEKALPGTIKVLMNMYTGFILASLQLNAIVDGTRTVRDYIRPVSTGMAYSGSREYLDASSIIDGFGSLDRPVAAKEVTDIAREFHLPSGRLIEVTVPSAVGKPNSVYINLQLNPRSIPTAVIEDIIATKVGRDMHKRWLQARAGEIRFFRDFLFQFDTMKRREKALKADKSKAMQDIYRQGRQSVLRTTLNMLASIAGGAGSSNIANSILILEEDDAVRYGKKYGLDFNKFSSRQKFLNKMGSLFVVLVSTRFSIVNIYTHSMKEHSEYSFRDIEALGKSDKADVATVMEYMSKNQMPKF